MTEAGLLIGDSGNPLYTHLPAGRSAVYLPDDHSLWDAMMTFRDILAGFAHSHPGGGVPAPSWEDITTFAAVEAGLGRRLAWWIASSDATVLVTWSGPDRLDYRVVALADVPAWTGQLLALSEI